MNSERWELHLRERIAELELALKKANWKAWRQRQRAEMWRERALRKKRA